MFSTFRGYWKRVSYYKNFLKQAKNYSYVNTFLIKVHWEICLDSLWCNQFKNIFNVITYFRFTLECNVFKNWNWRKLAFKSILPFYLNLIPIITSNLVHLNFVNGSLRSPKSLGVCSVTPKQTTTSSIFKRIR